MIDSEILRRLARETGVRLAELGVRPDDERWVRAQASAIASLRGEPRPSGVAARLYRLARRAARIAR